MFKGKAVYIHKLKLADEADKFPLDAAQAAADAGFSAVIPKILDGRWKYNLRPYYDAAGNLQWMDDILKPFVDACHSLGLKVFGYQYVYLSSPELEALAAVERVNQLGLDGFVMDGEVQCKGKHAAALQYTDILHVDASFPIALSTYRFPSYHPNFPYVEFMSVADEMWPQCYWQGAHNPVEQLDRTVNEWSKMTDKPIKPTGSAYSEWGWTATPDEVLAYTAAAKQSELEGVSYWVWAHMRAIAGMWEAIAGFDWATDTTPPDPTEVPFDEWVVEHLYPWTVQQGYTGPAPTYN